MSETVIQVRGLVKRFGALKAVSGVSFDVKRGEIFGILGPNGAGTSRSSTRKRYPTVSECPLLSGILLG